MIFPSLPFAVFFPVVFTISWLLMPHRLPWKLFILAASYVFYAAADPRYCLLLAGVTLVNQAGATLVLRDYSDRTKNRITAVIVLLNLGALGFFKYFNFFIEDFDRLLSGLGLGMPLPILNVVLPVGLSFFTFQAISYTVDVRRGICERSSLLDFGIYLAFFPHLVAGPIVRAREFLPQLATPRNPNEIAIGSGAVLVAIGLIKKVVIADYLARHAVDPFYADPGAFSGLDAWTAVIAFAAQIYCDFSGYTDIAIGLAMMMGFIFPLNFDRPYRSLSVREFWRRWHITLSRFIRDFVYIPLGGNRGSKWFVARNLMLSMLIAGLWHGAAWGFVVWGGLHGAALVFEHFASGRLREPSTVPRWMLVTLFVALAWIPFRAAELDLTWAVVERLIAPGPATLMSFGVAAMVAVVFLSNLVPARPLDAARDWLAGLHPALIGFALAVTIMVVAATVPNDSVPPFIYFQF